MRGRGSQVRQPSNNAQAGRGRAAANNTQANRGAAQARGTQIRQAAPMARMGAFGMPAVGMGRGQNTNFANAFNTMQELIQEYDDIGKSPIDELNKLSITAVAQRLTKAIKERDFVKFVIFVDAIKEELKKAENQEEYYYEEDVDSEEEKVESILKDPFAYVKKLAKIVDARTHESMMHLAVQQAAQNSDLRFLEKLLDINFPLYQEDINGHFPIFMLCLTENDDNFVNILRLFRKRKINLKKRSKKCEQNFLELFFQFRINQLRLKEILADKGLYLSSEDIDKYYEILNKHNQILTKEQKAGVVTDLYNIYYIERRKSFLFLVYQLQQRKSVHKLGTIKDGVLREIVKYL